MSKETKEDNKNHLYDERLKQYEERLVKVFKNISKEKRTNPKITKIMTYLFLHDALTQKELKELTGYSIGTISTYLSVLTGIFSTPGTAIKFVKQRIPGTHTYAYKLEGDTSQLFDSGLDIFLKFSETSKPFIKQNIKKLRDLEKNRKKGAKFLANRLEDINKVFEKYEEIFPKMLKDMEDRP